jgi:hypothetical protein
MSLALRIYAGLGTVVLVLCLALVAAMVVDSRMQPHSAADVVSSVDAGSGGD